MAGAVISSEELFGGNQDIVSSEELFGKKAKGGGLIELPRGLFEAGAALTTGLAGFIGGKAAGLGTLALTLGDAGAAKAVEEGVADYLTFKPTTETGKYFTEKLGKIVSAPAEVGKEAVALPMESWKVKKESPIGYLAETAGEIAPYGMIKPTGKLVRDVSRVEVPKFRDSLRGIENILDPGIETFTARTVAGKAKDQAARIYGEDVFDRLSYKRGVTSEEPAYTAGEGGDVRSNFTESERKINNYYDSLSEQAGNLEGQFSGLKAKEQRLVLESIERTKRRYIQELERFYFPEESIISSEELFREEPEPVLSRPVAESPFPENLEPRKTESVEAMAKIPKASEVRTPDIIGTEELMGERTVDVKPETGKPEPTGIKPASIAKSIEAKAIEQGLIKDGFDTLAGFDPTTMKKQAAQAADLLNTNPDAARRMVRGEEPLPEGLRGISLVKAMEEHIKVTKDPDLAYELANSPLASEVSLAAQELSLTRGRELDSFSAKVAEIKKARIEKAGKDATKKAAEIKKSLKVETKKLNLSRAELSWDKFLKSIEC